MTGLGLKTSVLLMGLMTWACSPVKPTATEYKEKLSAGASTTTKPTPSNGNPSGAPATPGSGAAPATGNAQNGLAILTTSCETAGCHKDSAPQLIKGTKIVDATVSKAAHRGVQPVFTKENINDMNAALANR